ncbi:MAG: nicotinate-nucleotide adenylyltransferase [Clostridiales bacterium]
MKIGICGGTFNPIHNAHLIISEEAKEFFNLDKVFFIPTGNPPHKKYVDKKCNIHRLEMVNEAIKNNQNFDVLDIEIKRKGYTYAIDTLRQIEKLFGDSEINYIIGSDVILDLINWKDYEEVFKICNFITFIRPSDDKKLVIDEIDKLKKDFNLKVFMFESILFNISSTIIRERVQKGFSIRYLVPDSVLEYICDNNLYIES